MEKADLKGITLKELQDFIATLNEPRFRAVQIFDWLYNKKVSKRVDCLSAMSNLGTTAVQKLSQTVYVTSLIPTDIISTGQKIVYSFRSQDDNKITSMSYGNNIIISSQIGCRYDCKFCPDGIKNFIRNQSSGEMIDQVLKIQKRLKHENSINRIEFASTGETLLNYDMLVKAIKILHEKKGLGISMHNIGVSTCGIAERIIRLARSGLRPGLSVSLNAADNKIRSFLMPVNDDYPVETVFEAVLFYTKMTGIRAVFDCVLLEGLNDSIADAKLLVKKLRGIPAKIRLNIFSPIERSSFIAASAEKQRSFADILTENNIETVIDIPLISARGEQSKHAKKLQEEVLFS